MPVNSTHPDYDDNIEPWQRIRDVLAGDRAIKRAGERYVARLDSQTDEEFQAYVERGFFYNATARTVAGYVGMIFRRDPVLQLPDSTVRPALKAFLNDVDLRGTTLDDYAKSIINDVVAIGRAGTLVDWEGSKENRPYACLYAAESILNWRQTRIDGQMKLSLVVLAEHGTPEPNPEDPFVVESIPQLRVLKLVDGKYQVELWQAPPGKDQKTAKGWKLISTSTPLRLGKPLTSIPFVFHGPYHGRPEVAKSPVEDLVAANLDHYRLNTDYKHGMHFTALPTAFVTGFDKNAQLRIGSTTAWVSETAGAKAAYLEFKGDGLSTFERALDRSERLLAVLGSRLLESQKRFSESAEALAIRQVGESSIIASISASVTASLNSVLRWVYWWQSTEATPEDVKPEHIHGSQSGNSVGSCFWGKGWMARRDEGEYPWWIFDRGSNAASGPLPRKPGGRVGSFVVCRRWLSLYSPLWGCSGLAALAHAKIPLRRTPRNFQTGSYKLNTDFEASLTSAAEMQALVLAWQSGAISRDTLLHNFRTGEILPSARTNEQEMELIRKEPAPIVPMEPRAVVAMGANGG